MLSLYSVVQRIILERQNTFHECAKSLILAIHILDLLHALQEFQHYLKKWLLLPTFTDRHDIVVLPNVNK